MFHLKGRFSSWLLALAAVLTIPLLGAMPASAATTAPSIAAKIQTTPSATASVPSPAPSAQNEPKIRISQIEIRGNKKVPEETILLAIPIHPGEEVTRQQVMDSMERIFALGYFRDPRDIRAWTEPSAGGEHLIISVIENPDLSGVSFEGNTVFPQAVLQSYFKEQLGKIVNFRDVKKALAEIEAKYRDGGYVLARINDVQVQPDGVLAVKIAEGRIEKIKLSGLEETQDYVVRRELTLKPGDVFNFNRMSDDLRRVYNLGFFEDIGLKYEPGTKPEDVVVVVNLKEKQTGDFRMSAGWSTRDGPLGMINIRKDNFLGRAQSIGLDLTVGGLFDASRRDVSADLNYFNPWIDADHTSLGLDVYARRYNNFYGLVTDPATGNSSRGFIEDRRGGMISLGRPLFGDPVTATWHGTLRLRGERIGVYQYDPTNWYSNSSYPAASVTGTGWDNAYSIAYTLQQDTRDYVFNPNKGWLNSLTLEQYLPMGDLHFSRLQLDLNRYVPIPLLSGHTFAIGAKSGTDVGTSGNAIPPYERFYSTGDSLIRGWDEAQFSGNSFVLGQAEWRFPIVSVLSGVWFADSGIFWDQTNPKEGFTWDKDHSGYGFGIRVTTPMGPLRLDLGLGGPGGIKPHFSIGQKF